MSNRRQCALIAAKRIRSQLGSDDETPSHNETSTAKPLGTATSVSSSKTDASGHPSKRLRPNRTRTTKLKDIANLQERLFDASYAFFDTEIETQTEVYSCRFPLRQHSLLYHRPLLLSGSIGKQGRAALLKWFDSVSTRRRMPWRKDWVNPEDHDDTAELRRVLSVRAYEVWISEIMLQQTRVSVVIDYWKRWMAKWPTIEQLAVAEEDEVTSAWRGLGYYSRAKRIHEAAKMVVQDPNWRGLLPQDAGELQAKIPGVGKYTAGAICSIVFGKATSVLGNVKSDKVVIDLLWAAADALVEAVVLEATGVDETGNPRPSDRPGRWGQALMELGSTICTPNPDCAACPITSTCRAHQEGKILVAMQSSCRETGSDVSGLVDIEDICGICEPFEVNAEEMAIDNDVATPKPSAYRRNQATVSSYFSSQTSGRTSKEVQDLPEPASVQAANVAGCHVRRFPLKAVRKALREQETLVCAVRRINDGRYLLQKRPEKGLLAGLWEFPTHILPDGNKTTSGTKRKLIAREFVTGLFEATDRAAGLKHRGELGSIPWVFSHLKLTMHVHVFQLEDDINQIAQALGQDAGRYQWADAESVEQETMGTGMRRCWKLIEEAGY
ncbi:A/G-specific adenine DNA glycosylase [Cytospora mali]|uniref:Adenine DNA glycosylase n=1 Tax=Cytospora mali TaxID=578113 RepID=A0A194WBV1_CYTMA|nr:A/G-specific adenine DNA glycosylase [Valsa mali]